jgi:hypothetical protein
LVFSNTFKGVPIITCETSSEASSGSARKFDTDNVAKAHILSPKEESGILNIMCYKNKAIV